jgi:hypothetical protein
MLIVSAYAKHLIDGRGLKGAFLVHGNGWPANWDYNFARQTHYETPWVVCGNFNPSKEFHDMWNADGENSLIEKEKFVKQQIENGFQDEEVCLNFIHHFGFQSNEETKSYLYKEAKSYIYRRHILNAQVDQLSEACADIENTSAGVLP